MVGVGEKKSQIKYDNFLEFMKSEEKERWFCTLVSSVLIVPATESSLIGSGDTCEIIKILMRMLMLIMIIIIITITETPVGERER